jgi:hypothetical protein
LVDRYQQVGRGFSLEPLHERRQLVRRYDIAVEDHDPTHALADKMQGFGVGS